MALIPYLIMIPLGAAFIIPLAGKRIEKAGGILAGLTVSVLTCLSFVIASSAMSGHVLVYRTGNWPLPAGIPLVIDTFSAFMLIVVNLVALPIIIYSTGYMGRYADRWKFFTLFMLMIAGINGVLIAGDIFNLYVFLELASIAAYFLVAFNTGAEELEASFKYAVMGSTASLFILLGIAFLYGRTETLNMADMAAVLAVQGGGRVVQLVSILFLAGFGLKAAFVPFHAWLPDAHPAAPAPISAMLSGVLIKALGVYALVRIFYNVIGVSSGVKALLMLAGALSMMVGVLLAVKQWDLKRLLAYHSISQIGYVILGIAIGTPLGVFGGLFHLFNHSVFKSLLFLNAGAVEYATGTRDLKDIGGLRENMPVTGATSLVASLSIAGIPPFNGFWSKLVIILAAVQAHRIGYASFAVLASILTLASFMKVQKYTFFGKANSRHSGVREAPISMQLAMIMLAAICIAGGVLIIPSLWRDFMVQAGNVVMAGTDYATAVLGNVR